MRSIIGGIIIADLREALPELNDGELSLQLTPGQAQAMI
jgi:hypothetical protein